MASNDDIYGGDEGDDGKLAEAKTDFGRSSCYLTYFGDIRGADREKLYGIAKKVEALEDAFNVKGAIGSYALEKCVDDNRGKDRATRIEAVSNLITSAIPNAFKPEEVTDMATTYVDAMHLRATMDRQFESIVGGVSIHTRKDVVDSLSQVIGISETAATRAATRLVEKFEDEASKALGVGKYRSL